MFCSEIRGCSAGLLPYAPVVEGFGIFAGVEHMGAVVGGKVVCPGEIFLGAHIYIIVLRVVQYGINARHRGDADGAWRKSCMSVGVVRTVAKQVFVKDSAKGKIAEGEFHGRVGLERHVTVQTVDVHASHYGTLRDELGFLFYNAGKCQRIVSGETGGDVLQAGTALGIPESIAFALHALHQSSGCNRPINFVSVRDEKAYCRFTLQRVCCLKAAVCKGFVEAVGRHLKVLAKKIRKVVNSPQSWDGELQRLFLPRLQMT